jgi:NO-binding membrane sensor protein with MHYT domain
MVFTFTSPLVFAAKLKLTVRTLVGARRVGSGVASSHFFGNHIEADAV